MHRVLPIKLQLMNYCNVIEGFINYVLSNPKSISGGDIRRRYKMCKNKKLIDPNVAMMHLL
jgi:hypothetical protein